MVCFKQRRTLVFEQFLALAFVQMKAIDFNQRIVRIIAGSIERMGEYGLSVSRSSADHDRSFPVDHAQGLCQ